ncbi:MAG: hypothetical protein V1645_01920, partial [archaeon]
MNCKKEIIQTTLTRWEKRSELKIGKKGRSLLFIVLILTVLGIILTFNVVSENITLNNYSEMTSTNLTPEFNISEEIAIENTTTSLATNDFITQDATTAPDIEFVDPTTADQTATDNTSIEINISITNVADLLNFTWGWNGVNYTLYNSSIVLMLN